MFFFPHCLPWSLLKFTTPCLQSLVPVLAPCVAVTQAWWRMGWLNQSPFTFYYTARHLWRFLKAGLFLFDAARICWWKMTHCPPFSCHSFYGWGRDRLVVDTYWFINTVNPVKMVSCHRFSSWQLLVQKDAHGLWVDLSTKFFFFLLHSSYITSSKSISNSLRMTQAEANGTLNDRDM